MPCIPIRENIERSISDAEVIEPKGAWFAAIATAILICAIMVGSRNLQNFDAALVAYLFGATFAFFGIAYRYSVWLQRPPTWRYFVRTWQLLFSPRFLPLLTLITRDFVGRIMAQRFILLRGTKRWVCFQQFHSPAWGYLAMAVFALFCSGLNAWVCVRTGKY